MLDEELLEDFCGTFAGYGNLDADVWFIGMEEGSGHTEVEIETRLRRVASLGGDAVQ